MSDELARAIEVLNARKDAAHGEEEERGSQVYDFHDGWRAIVSDLDVDLDEFHHCTQVIAQQLLAVHAGRILSALNDTEPGPVRFNPTASMLDALGTAFGDGLVLGLLVAKAREKVET